MILISLYFLTICALPRRSLRGHVPVDFTHPAPEGKAPEGVIVATESAKKVVRVPLRALGGGAQFVGVVEVGSDKKQTPVVFDTGSELSWITRDTVLNEPSDETFFLSKQRPPPTVYTLHYASQSVNLVPSTGQNAALKFGSSSVNIPFSEAGQYSRNSRRNRPFDGVLGLSKRASFVPSLVRAGIIAAPVVHVDHAAQIILGQPNGGSTLENSTVWLQSTPHPHLWTVGLRDILVNGVSALPPSKKFKIHAVALDTGTALNILPEEVVANLARLGVYMPNCTDNTMKALPRLSFVFATEGREDFVVELQGRDYTLLTRMDAFPLPHVGFPSLDHSQAPVLCSPSFVSKKNNVDHTWLLGSSVLSKVDTIFDFDKQRVGMS